MQTRFSPGCNRTDTFHREALHGKTAVHSLTPLRESVMVLRLTLTWERLIGRFKEAVKGRVSSASEAQIASWSEPRRAATMGESPVVSPGSSDRSRTNDPRSLSEPFNSPGSGVGGNQAYMGGAIGAGTPMAFNAAIGAGAGGAYP